MHAYIRGTYFNSDLYITQFSTPRTGPIVVCNKYEANILKRACTASARLYPQELTAAVTRFIRDGRIGWKDWMEGFFIEDRMLSIVKVSRYISKAQRDK